MHDEETVLEFEDKLERLNYSIDRKMHSYRRRLHNMEKIIAGHNKELAEMNELRQRYHEGLQKSEKLQAALRMIHSRLDELTDLFDRKNGQIFDEVKAIRGLAQIALNQNDQDEAEADDRNPA